MGAMRLAWMGMAALLLGGGAMAQDSMPEGWFLEEFESPGLTDLYLYWLDPALGGQALQISCQAGWPDVVVSAFMDEPATPPAEVALVAGETRHVLDLLASGSVDGRYSTGALTRFTPEVVDILSGAFSIEVDGAEQGRYSAEEAKAEFSRLFEACPADGDGT